MSHRVVVTGGAGRIGSRLAARLVQDGHEVTVIDRKTPAERHGRWVYADLRDRTTLQPIFEQAYAVFHLGELPNAASAPNPHEVYVNNTAVASTVLETAVDVKLPRLVYTSSCQVYGLWGGAYDPHRVRPMSMPMTEAQPFHPRNGYAAAKVAGELYAQMLGEVRGLSASIFRLPATMDGEWLWWYRKDERRFRRAVHESDGLWTWLHIDDAVNAYLAAMEKQQPGIEAYHFSAPDVLGLVPLAERISELPPGWPALPADSGTRTMLNCEKAGRLLGWQALRSFAELSKEKE